MTEPLQKLCPQPAIVISYFQRMDEAELLAITRRFDRRNYYDRVLAVWNYSNGRQSC